MPKDKVYKINLVNTLEKNLSITASSKQKAEQLLQSFINDISTFDYDDESGWEINYIYDYKDEYLTDQIVQLLLIVITINISKIRSYYD